MEKLVNLMEEIVRLTYNEVISDINVCKCETCKLDIMAKALNDLPPKYFITTQGRVFKKIETLRGQLEVDIISAITKASILVKRYPRHKHKQE